MRTGFSSFFVIAILCITTSCSAPEPVTSSEPRPETNNTSVYPDWYNRFETASQDSLTVYGFATAVASDSLIAMQRAEVQARNELGSMLSSQLEKIRQQIESEDTAGASEPDFILHLRTAHLSVVEAADVKQSSVRKTGDVFRAFTMISVQKTQADDLLKKAFGNNKRYWDLFSGSDAYQNFLK